MADTIYDKAIKYGYRYGGCQTITVPATNADYINRRGAGFVKITGGIARTLASNDTTVSGWLTVPKETTHGNSVQLNGNDYAVITDPTAVFEAPVSEVNASLTATHIGESCFLVESGSTTSKTQKCKLGAGGAVAAASALLLIQDVDVANKSVFVRINPAKYNYS